MFRCVLLVISHFTALSVSSLFPQSDMFHEITVEKIANLLLFVSLVTLRALISVVVPSLAAHNLSQRKTRKGWHYEIPTFTTMTKKSRALRPGSGQGPKKPSPQQIQFSRKSLRWKKGGANNEANNNSDEQLFSVEKIVDCKLDRNGVPTYKTRWTGYSASDDTWEPYENVVSTGHV